MTIHVPDGQLMAEGEGMCVVWNGEAPPRTAAADRRGCAPGP